MKILLSIALIFVTTVPAWATSWVVRDGGGSVYGTSQATNTCNGQTNAVYSFGASPNCAARNLPLITGYCTNNGSSCAPAGHWAAGDTITIVGDSDTSPGSQAQYQIGQGSPDESSCTSGIASDCIIAGFPAGSDSSHRTTIIGTGTHRPQIYATSNPWQLLIMNNSHLALSNVELATHSTCGYNSPDTQCSNGEGSNRTTDGIYMVGDDINLTDVWIHGMSRYGIVTGSLTTDTFTRVWLIGNAYGGFTLGNGDSSSGNGTLTWNQPIIEWNGCLENYPLTSGIDSPTDHVKCYGQGSNGYGDGVAFGPSGSQNAGNWTITGPGSISFNTQDGFDTLHGSGNGTIQIDKMRFEGNAGNQVKMNAATSSLTNSIIFGDCGWWYGSANASSSGMGTSDTCRAVGDSILFNIANSVTVTLYNDTVVSNGNIALESKDINSVGCDGTQSITVKNLAVLAGYAWYDDTTWNGLGGNSTTTRIYNAGNNGDGAGTCGSISWTQDYNIMSGGHDGSIACGGAHSQCGTSIGFTGTIPMGTSGGAANTYYQGTSGVTLVDLTSGSAAKGAGVSGLTYWNNENDYYNVTRPSPPSMGALEYASCAAGAWGCFYNSDCCSSTCTNNLCTSSGGGGSTGTGDVMSGSFTMKGILAQ